MRITKKQLKRIIKEEYSRLQKERTRVSKEDLGRLVRESIIAESSRQRLGIVGDTIYVTHGLYGSSYEDEEENPIPAGEMIADLMDSDDVDFFNAAQGVDMKSLNRLIDKWSAGDAGPLTSWDVDVFTDYYNVDMSRVVRLWARRNDMRIEEVGSEVNETKKRKYTK